jgi:hypothetical protein
MSLCATCVSQNPLSPPCTSYCCSVIACHPLYLVRYRLRSACFASQVACVVTSSTLRVSGLSQPGNGLTSTAIHQSTHAQPSFDVGRTWFSHIPRITSFSTSTSVFHTELCTAPQQCLLFPRERRTKYMPSQTEKAFECVKERTGNRRPYTVHIYGNHEKSSPSS